MKPTIYHNPRCSKSRQTLELLQSKGLELRVVEYLKTPPSAKELENILSLLHLKPQDIIRKGEEVYKNLELAKKNLSDPEWINLLIQHPILIERPIVVIENKAALGRPPEKALEIL